MDIRHQLLKAHSRQNADIVESYVVETPGAIIRLMTCFFCDEVNVAQRAAQVVGNLGRNHPVMLEPWWEEMVTAAEEPVHDAIRRNVARYFSELELELPETLESRMVDSFTTWICEDKTPVAVAAFAMQFVADRCLRYPEHAQQVRQMIERKMDSASAGFQSRGKKILRQIEKAL